MISKPGHSQVLFEFSKARRGYEDNISYYVLLCSSVQWVGSDQHRSLCQAPGAGKERKERVVALLSVPWTHAQGMQQPHAHSWKQSGC